MLSKLNILFASLSPIDQEAVKQQLHAQTLHLAALHDSSHARIKALLLPNHDNEKPDFGTGIYLARWLALLDDTALSPALAEGPVRYGGDGEGQKIGGEGQTGIDYGGRRRPDVGKTVSLLSGGFWEMLRDWDGDRCKEGGGG